MAAASDDDLDGLRLSQLLQRARESGASQSSLDELMDGDDPRAAVLALVRRRAGRAPVPPLFDATRVGETPLPPEGWLGPFAAEGYAAFPGVLSDRACDDLAAELEAGPGAAGGDGLLGPVGEALLECGFVRALISGALGEQYELCHCTGDAAAPRRGFLPPADAAGADGLEATLLQEHWQRAGQPPWCEAGFAYALAYLRVVILPRGCPREAGLCIVPGSHGVAASQLSQLLHAPGRGGGGGGRGGGDAEALLRSEYRLAARELYLPERTMRVIDGRTWRGVSSEAASRASAVATAGGETAAAAAAAAAAVPVLGLAFKLPSPPHPSTAVLPSAWSAEGGERTGGAADSYRKMLFARQPSGSEEQAPKSKAADAAAAPKL